MPFDDNGNYYEDPKPENDWGNPYGSDTKANMVWGMKMLLWLIFAVVLGIGGWLVERHINYELFYKPMFEADMEED